MKVLVVGGGGREHAIIKKLKENKQVETVYAVPGNGGIAEDAVCVPEIGAKELDKIVAFAKEKAVDFVVVAPDDPLALGCVDKLHEAGIPCFGPDAKAARIEASKVFSKNLMKKYGIPTAKYEVFSKPAEALDYLKAADYPIVIKADGLALGKGVLIPTNYQEAEDAIKSIMEDKVFGASGNEVVIEEFLTGPEVSVLAFTDGTAIAPMVSSMDHKPAYDGNKGPNTGGMGTISPNPFYSDDVAERCRKEIFEPTVAAMSAEGRPFKGCLYFGLMITKDGPKVIEYNCRFGDPETQVVLPRLKTDLLDVINAVIDEKLDELDVQWDNGACACVILASGGYPGSYERGKVISGLDADGQVDGATVYHAGTSGENGTYATNGGRVLGITANGADLDAAIDAAYAAAAKIDFEGKQFRTDIGRCVR